MSEFANTPKMDWVSAVEQGADGGGRVKVVQRARCTTQLPDTQIQPHTFDGTSNATGYDSLLGCQFDTTSISDADGPPAIEFKSGCRVIEYQEPKSRRQRQIEDPQRDRFVCLWSPCKSTRPTFGRMAELQRHYNEQHVRLEIFDCTAVGCPAKGPKGLTRLDKLLSHLKNKHSKSTSFLCPVTQCRGGPFPADLLQVHMYWHNQTYRDYFEIIQDGTNYRAACPVQGCHGGLRFRNHSLSHDHDIETRKRNASVILAAGYSPTSGLPVCPVCNVELELDHRYRAGTVNKEHFLSHDWESLYKHRRHILNICPEFGAAPIFRRAFEDIMLSWRAPTYLDQSCGRLAKRSGVSMVTTIPTVPDPLQDWQEEPVGVADFR